MSRDYRNIINKMDTAYGFFKSKGGVKLFFLLFAYVFNFTFSLCVSMDLKIEDNFYKSANVA